MAAAVDLDCPDPEFRHEFEALGPAAEDVSLQSHIGVICDLDSLVDAAVGNDHGDGSEQFFPCELGLIVQSADQGRIQEPALADVRTTAACDDLCTRLDRSGHAGLDPVPLGRGDDRT